MNSTGFSIPSANIVERSWLQEDGLPSNIVSRVVQDRDGFLWVATSSGISRFDGRRFQTIPVPRPNPSIRDAALAPDGSLICLPRAGGVFSLKAGSIAEHPASQMLPAETLLRAYVDPAGAIWLGGNDLYRWYNGSLQRFGRESGFSREYGTRYSFATDGAGTTWIGVGSRVFRYKGDKLDVFAAGLTSAAVVAPSRAGGVWIFLGDRMVLVHDGRSPEVLGELDWSSMGEVVSVLEDRSGGLWIATRAHGVFFWSGGTLFSVPVSHQKISALLEDTEGNLWLASDGGGLIRLKQKAFILLNSVSGLQVDVSNSVAVDSFGALWIANNEGGLIRWFEGNQTQVFKGARDKDRCFLVCADANGRIWFSMSDGLYRVSIENLGRVEKVEEIAGPVDALHCAKNGDMWISARDKTVGFFRNDLYHALSVAPGAPDQRLVAFDEDDHGNLWIASNPDELYQFTFDRFTRVALPHTVGRIHDIHADKRGGLWLSTQNGLVRRDESGRYDVISSKDGLPGDTILQMLEDANSRLWLASTNGIFNITFDSLYDRLEGGESRLDIKTFGRNEGLLGASAFFSGPPTACQGKDGALWFVTHRGVVGMLPEMAKGSGGPIPVYIDSVVVDGTPQTANGENRLRIRTQKSKIDFHLVALNYAAPEKIRIFHRLAGLDVNWIETGADGKASYGQLPPGSYTMWVRAGTDERWNDEGVSMAISVAAAWWQTWWFRLSCFFGVVGLVFIVVNFWTHRRLRLQLDRLERAHALELERARIARDLHDDLGGSLTHIRLMAERLKKESAESAWGPSLARLADCARQITTTLEGIIWTINPKNSSWSALVNFLASYTRKASEGAGVDCVIEKPDTLGNVAIMPEIQHHVLAIAKEAISNALKHSEATGIRMTMSSDKEYFALKISDDGIGFDVAVADRSERNGLRNMRSRTLEIGGEIVVSSQPGRGTTLILRVRLKGKCGAVSPAEVADSIYSKINA